MDEWLDGGLAGSSASVTHSQRVLFGFLCAKLSSGREKEREKDKERERGRRKREDLSS